MTNGCSADQLLKIVAMTNSREARKPAPLPDRFKHLRYSIFLLFANVCIVGMLNRT